MRKPAGIASVSVLSALSGAVGSGVLGAAIMAGVWSSRTPEAAARAVHWALLHGILIGASGVVTGVLVGLTATMLAPRLTHRRALALGATIGAILGSALGAVVWSDAGGGPVAVASFLAQSFAGALIAVVARRRALPH